MRQTAGAWLRNRVRNRRVTHGLFMMLAFGYILGAGISFWIVPLLGGEPWMVLLAGTFLIGVWFIAYIRDKDLNDARWPIQDMEKGADAEEAVGQLIEYVMTREGCAVAHHVEEIARYGDIDHLVATPKNLWVIETKSARIPGDQFRKTLNQIKANVDAVKQWAPDVQVNGCIVFGGREKVSAKKQHYSVGDTVIRCFEKPTDLMVVLREEARSTVQSTSLAQRVWSLANVENAD